jgi:ABC-2 type transport system ATP-binding protein
METTNDAAIEARELTRVFGHRLAVDRLSMRVARGRIFGLLGPNGAGKSTTIKMLTTLLAPSSGEARVAGHDVVAGAADVRRRIGYVPQLLSADGALTARENLTLSARLYGMSGAEGRERIEEALRFMGLEAVADDLVRTYSGGTIRRLELAQAMLHHPAVLFLDEPTIGLDPVARHGVWDRLLGLRAAYGTTILITTHDMEEADRLCDAIAILHVGRIAASGAPADLKAQVRPGAGLDEVFVHFSGASIERGGGYRDVGHVRSVAKRLG